MNYSKALISRAIIDEFFEKKGSTEIQIMTKSWNEGKTFTPVDFRGPRWGEKEKLSLEEPFISVRKILDSRYNIQNISLDDIKKVYADLINKGYFEFSHHPTNNNLISTIKPKERLQRKVINRNFFYTTIGIYRKINTLRNFFAKPKAKKITKGVFFALGAIGTVITFWQIFF